VLPVVADWSSTSISKNQTKHIGPLTWDIRGFLIVDGAAAARFRVRCGGPERMGGRS
jgi:hypothetical protein